MDAKQLTAPVITQQIVDNALRALYRVHTAYVQHGDIHQRNILPLPDNRVVWINFDNAICGTERNDALQTQRGNLLDESAEGWSLSYGAMVNIFGC